MRNWHFHKWLSRTYTIDKYRSLDHFQQLYPFVVNRLAASISQFSQHSNETWRLQPSPYKKGEEGVRKTLSEWLEHLDRLLT